MQLQELKIKGYRTLRNVSWKPGALNVIIGPNASGKSNLLKFLRLIRASVNGKLSDHIVNEGGIEAILWNSIENEISIDIKTAILNYNLTFNNKAIISVEYLRDTNNQVILIVRNGTEVTINTYTNGIKFVNQPRIDQNETALSLTKGTLSEGVSSDFSSFLNTFAIYDNLNTSQNSEIRSATVSRYVERLDDDGQNLPAVLHTFYETDGEFQQQIDNAMTAAFGSEYESLAFPPAGSQRIEMALRWKSLKRPQPAISLSDGTLKFLFIITALSLPKLPSLICIDEPETGLHPSMLPIIAEYAYNASLKTQVIFTTHSVQFLDAFKDHAPTVTVSTLQNGETKLIILDQNKLSYWLKEYSLGTLFNSGELENMAEDTPIEE